jgi:hypothetical protein
MTQNLTFLYIKHHTVTGKLYFGKTTKDPLTYNGSGKYWLRHLKVHGLEYVVTLWYELFTDQAELESFALEFSEKMNIVKSNQWLNLKPENGLDGGSIGHSLESRQKMSRSQTGKRLSQQTKDKVSAFWKGKPKSTEHKEKIRQSHLLLTNEERAKQLSYAVLPKSSETKAKMKAAALNRDPNHNIKIGLAQRGKIISDEQKQKIRETLARRPQVICPHCQRKMIIQNFNRWHGAKCKLHAITIRTGTALPEL